MPTKGDFLGKSAYEVANNSVKETFHVYIFEQIAMGRSDTVELLINGRVPTDLCDDSPSQDSLLHWACSFDQFPVAELLLKNHVNPNIVNANGQSCLHLACQSGNNKFVDLLLDYGANVSIKDSSGKTPLDLVPANIPINPRLVNTQHKVPLLNIPEIQEQDVNNRTESCLDSDGESGYDTDTSDPLDRINYQNSRQSYPPKQLILWPPVQRQTQYSKEDHPPLILSNDSPVVICSDSDDIDIYPLLTWSGLIDTLNNLGLQSSVQRAALSGKIRLSIDSIVCPGRQRFEILISTHGLTIHQNLTLV